MVKKVLSTVLVFILTLGLLMTGNTAKASTKDNWNFQRYGDILDAGTKIRKQEKDPDYRAKQDAAIIKSAENFDVNKAAEETPKSSFTFNGPVKIFLGYDSVYGYYLKTYTLRSIGNNVEIWVSNNLAFYKPDGTLDESRPAHVVTQSQVDHMRDVFDEKVYPTDTSFFGTPDSHTGTNSILTNAYYKKYGEYVNYQPSSYIPEGYEQKERVMILVDNIRDDNYYNPDYPFIIGGFYSPTYESYFDRNIINIDSSNWEARLDKDWLPTTAHEFQHLIHDDNDPAEETWINEGMADFAEYLCFGSHPMDHVNFFLDHPENSLVVWDEYNSDKDPETLADYGQAYLFQLYLDDQYGRDFIQALAKDKKHGIESVNEVLNQFNKGIDFEELFRRFTIALAVDSNTPGDGIYNFKSIDLKVNYASALEHDKDGVPAWGADYKKINDPSKIESIIFDGINFMPTPWKVIDDPVNKGNKVLWGNNGNMKDNMAIMEADLSSLTAKATLQFDTLIRIEDGWDAGMVQVSADGGNTWTSLANENTIDKDNFKLNEQAPNIYNNLPGFTGVNDKWTKETFDLTPYIGKKILINFRYMTDAASNEDGWFIDNVEIPEIGYKNDCSSIDGFIGYDELKGIKVDYAVTFINEKSLGKGNNKQHYQVLNIKPFSIDEADAETLKGFLSGGNNYMIVWYAAPVGRTDPVPFSYDIIKKSEVKNKKK